MVDRVTLDELAAVVARGFEDPRRDLRSEIREGAGAVRDDLRAEMQQTAEALPGEMQQTVETLRGEMQALRTALQQVMYVGFAHVTLNAERSHRHAQRSCAPIRADRTAARHGHGAGSKPPPIRTAVFFALLWEFSNIHHRGCNIGKQFACHRIDDAAEAYSLNPTARIEIGFITHRGLSSRIVRIIEEVSDVQRLPHRAKMRDDLLLKGTDHF